MTVKLEHWVYLAVGCATAAFLVLLFFIGPTGWLVAALLLFAIFKLVDWSHLFRAAPVQPKFNCPECGARNPIDRASCHYCTAALRDSDDGFEGA